MFIQSLAHICSYQVPCTVFSTERTINFTHFYGYWLLPKVLNLGPKSFGLTLLAYGDVLALCEGKCDSSVIIGIAQMQIHNQRPIGTDLLIWRENGAIFPLPGFICWIFFQSHPMIGLHQFKEILFEITNKASSQNVSKYKVNHLIIFSPVEESAFCPLLEFQLQQHIYYMIPTIFVLSYFEYRRIWGWCIRAWCLYYMSGSYSRELPHMVGLNIGR